MKRDMELTHLILQAIEEYNDPYGMENIPKIPNHQPISVSYHIKILADAGWIKAEPVVEFGTEFDEYRRINLTNIGHDVLDKMNEDNKWDKFKGFLATTGKTFSLDLLLEYAKGLIQ